MRRRRAVWDKFLHPRTDGVAVENDAAFAVAGGASGGLDERARRTEKTDFICIEDGDKCNFRQVDPFAEQIDTDKAVEVAVPEFVEDANPFNGVEFTVEIAGADTDFREVIGEAFSILFGQCGDESAFAASGTFTDLGDDIIEFVFQRADFDFGVEQSGAVTSKSELPM